MASIRKRALPSGKTAWQVDYRDNQGKRRHRQFLTKREADLPGASPGRNRGRRPHSG